MNRAVLLDRGGVINEVVLGAEGPDSPRTVEEFKLIAGAAKAIRRLNQLGLPVVIVSNQPGVAKGKFPAANLAAMTDVMEGALRDESAAIQGVYYCMHHPDAVVDSYREVCDCRKPKPGLLMRAAKDMAIQLEGSYMIGDQARDMVAGRLAGCTTLLVGGAPPSDASADADHACVDLYAAARLIAQLENSSLTIH